jgi:hypothetical protein
LVYKNNCRKPPQLSYISSFPHFLPYFYFIRLCYHKPIKSNPIWQLLQATVVETHPTTKEILLTTENAHAKPVKKAVKAVAVTAGALLHRHPALLHPVARAVDGMAILRGTQRQDVTATTTTNFYLHKFATGRAAVGSLPGYFLMT